MLQLDHLAWQLPSGEAIIEDITLTIPDHKLVVVTGPNGGGKTSMAKLIAGIETPSSGSIRFDGEANRYSDDLNVGAIFELDRVQTLSIAGGGGRSCLIRI